MKFNKIVSEYDKYVLNTYGKRCMFIKTGKGCYVYDENNNKYLDFLSGISVNSLGYSHPAITKRINKESEILLHTSNLYYTNNQLLLAKKLIKNSFNGRVFFCNSGTEANEAAIKLIHKYGTSNKIKNVEIISFENSFHGRTLASLSATGQNKYQKGFEPLVPGFKYVKFNDFNNFKSKVTKNTAGVIIEVIQAEGGINVGTKKFISDVHKFCKNKNILLAVDEVQTGIGKTGMQFAYMHYNIKPDIITLAKALGAGLPMGAMIVSEKYKNILNPGTHASTFGGNSLIAGAACTMLDIIFKENFLAKVRDKSRYLISLLTELKNKTNKINNIRGKGLLIGFNVKGDNKKLAAECLKRKLILNALLTNSIRLSPPLIITKKELKKAVQIIENSLNII